MRFPIRLGAWFVSATCATGITLAQTKDATLTHDVAAKLEALTPTHPEAYFLLGEELSDHRRNADRHRLAEHMLVLAAELSLASDPHAPLAAQSCLALADLSTGEKSRRWLTALAHVIDQRQAPPAWMIVAPPSTPESEAYRLATAIGYVRTGEGARARQLFSKPELSRMLERVESPLMRLGSGVGVGGIRREAELWPCSECGNERIVRRMIAGKPENVLCPRCHGLPGPKWSESELLAQLKFESWLLQGDNRTWAAQLDADRAAPLLEPDAGGLARAFGVDLTKPYFRAGAWAASPDATTKTSPDAPAPHVKPIEPPETPAPQPSKNDDPPPAPTGPR